MTSTPTSELRPWPRARLLILGYALYVLGGPGMLLPGGTPLGALGLVFWALAASRPGPRKKRIEWLLGGAALLAQTAWMGIVFWFALLWLFIGFGCWSVWGGWWMKRLASRFPLALATPVAWIGFESLLAWTPPPIGLSWLRLGHYMADFPGLAGSGRVWGVMGLGFALAALAGLIADCIRARGLAVGRLAWCAGLGPAVAAGVLGILVAAPATEPGPRLLLVQPNISQARKQRSATPLEVFNESVSLTAEGLRELADQNASAPHLVVWSETMVPALLSEPGLEELIEDLKIDPWSPLGGVAPGSLRDTVRYSNQNEMDILRNFFGGESNGREVLGLLPEGTGFLSGVELMKAVDGRLRRANAVILWEVGVRAGTGFKQHLAPGGETMVGLESFEWVRDVIYEVAGYIPDFHAGEETSVFALDRAQARPWTFGVSVCFDNAFPDVYASPLRAQDMDFHLAVSNEAWYLDAQELDQMVCFTRMFALCTGRSFVRCANSGVSAAFGADGQELGRLRVGESDRQVSGTLTVTVPVPTLEAAGRRTPYVWLQPWLLPAAALLPLLLGLLTKRVPRIALEET